MSQSLTYYKTLLLQIEQLEKQCKTVSISQLPSTINYKRKSSFIKSNNNTNKKVRRV